MCPLNKVECNSSVHHSVFCKLHLETAIKKERSSLPLSHIVSGSELILDYIAWSSNPNDNNKVLLPIYWAHSA